MEKIQNKKTDKERAFYGTQDTEFESIFIGGPADGESAFKECQNINVTNSKFHLRYPFWHNSDLLVKDSMMADTCRAAFWYDKNVVVDNVNSKGVKAFRECQNITMINCDFESEEIFWKNETINLKDSTVNGVYAFFMSSNITIDNMKFKGKYSFQYCKNVKIQNSVLDTKDAFWHAENVIVENCEVIGEYLGWYANGITFKNCKISGTQPLCYATGIKFIDCVFEKTDLAFEYSEVEGNISGKIDSIKNPLKGTIVMTGEAELIQDENDRSEGKFTLVK